MFGSPGRAEIRARLAGERAYKSSSSSAGMTRIRFKGLGRPAVSQPLRGAPLGTTPNVRRAKGVVNARPRQAETASRSGRRRRLGEGTALAPGRTGRHAGL